MSIKRYSLLFILLLAGPLVCHAEIFKWTDANGRVHFGDKPTDKQIKAEEVEVKDYKPGSDDDTRAITERRQRLMNADDGRKQNADAAAKAAADAQQTRCAAAREDLRRVSGRVDFLDENGKSVHTTEQQRIERQREVAAWIQDNCP